MPFQLQLGRAGPRVPHLRCLVIAAGDDPRAVSAERDASHPGRVPVECEDSARGPSAQIVPFPATMFVFDTVQAEASLRDVAVIVCGDGQKKAAVVELTIALLDPLGLTRQRVLCLSERLIALLASVGLVGLGSLRVHAAFLGPNQSPRRPHNPSQKGEQHQTRRDDLPLVPAHEFLEAVTRAWWPGLDDLVRAIALDVASQGVGSLVTALAWCL